MKKLTKVPSNICTGRIKGDNSGKRKLAPSSREESNGKPIQEKVNPIPKSKSETVEKTNINKIKIDLSKPKIAKGGEEEKRSLADAFDTDGKPEPIKELYIPKNDDSDEELEMGSSTMGSDTEQPTAKPIITQKKRKRNKRNSGYKPAPTLSEEVKWDDDIQDENFVSWTPPVGQTGDGRTKLNDKYGY